MKTGSPINGLRIIVERKSPTTRQAKSRRLQSTEKINEFGLMNSATISMFNTISGSEYPKGYSPRPFIPPDDTKKNIKRNLSQGRIKGVLLNKKNIISKHIVKKIITEAKFPEENTKNIILNKQQNNDQPRIIQEKIKSLRDFSEEQRQNGLIRTRNEKTRNCARPLTSPKWEKSAPVISFSVNSRNNFINPFHRKLASLLPIHNQRINTGIPQVNRAFSNKISANPVSDFHTIPRPKSPPKLQTPFFLPLKNQRDQMPSTGFPIFQFNIPPDSGRKPDRKVSFDPREAISHFVNDTQKEKLVEKKLKIKLQNENLKELIARQCSEVERALQNKDQKSAKSNEYSRLTCLLLAIEKMNRLGLTPKDFTKECVFSKNPYANRRSKSFFIAIKLGDKITVNHMLARNRYLVYDHDFVKQTGLHWASRKGNGEIMKLLLNYGADIDACDIMNRTALYFACKKNHMECVKMLIFYQPDPFIVAKNGKTAIDVTTDLFIQLYIKKAKQVTILLKWVKLKLRREIWDHWIHYIFHDPLSKPSEALEAMFLAIGDKSPVKK